MSSKETWGEVEGDDDYFDGVFLTMSIFFLLKISYKDE